MKLFQDDAPLLRYGLLIFATVLGSFVGAISGILLFGVLFKG